ncbi:MAG: acyl-ACP--UDP-N-acetylglucosamine O-acyltransferase [Parvularculaceae bacterium]|nr:acyl-ACP--UDP-N-acetylglucosamine O-acyltransferase [Parvularculaceae bacterium]
MRVHPTAIVESGAVLGEGVEIGPWCVVSSGARLGAGVRLSNHVVLEGDVVVGARTVVHPFAVLGGPPQHLGYKGEPTRLEIGEDCIIREHVTMNRGTAAGGGLTRVGRKCMFMTGSHVGHDCVVGDENVFANNASIGGHVTIGSFAFFGALCGVHQFCRIGDYVMIGGCAGVTEDVIPYGMAVGNHASLDGLNVVGMKRRGVSREAIHDVRRAYRRLFNDEGVFADRLAAVEQEFSGRPEVRRIVDFIKADAKRSVMAPKR